MQYLLNLLILLVAQSFAWTLSNGFSTKQRMKQSSLLAASLSSTTNHPTDHHSVPFFISTSDTDATTRVNGINGASSLVVKEEAELHHHDSPIQQHQPSNKAAAESLAVVDQGRVLEGGKVIDFGNVKATSRAEQALLEARNHVLATTASSSVLTTSSKTEILGIHQDVIDLVGHSLGDFATPVQVQECAAWLRSLALPSLFSEVTASTSSFDSSSIAQYKKILNQAYDEAGEVTAAYAKTFYMGTMLLPEQARRAIWAIYVWCRRTDEIVDAPREAQTDNNNDKPDEMLLDLSAWELRLEQLWATGNVVDVYDLCLLDVRVQYPTLDRTPFMDMIRGMLMDVPGLGQDRYDTFDELHLYCYRVAGTVGIMSLPVFGCAPGFTDEVARYDE
jgi:phytoene synthase